MRVQNRIKNGVLLGVWLAVLGGVLLCHSEPVLAFSASLTTGSSITLDVQPYGNGTSIHEESINVTSDCRDGYNLSVGTTKSSSLYAGGVSTGTAAFTAVDGTSALNSSSNTNKWGYTITSGATDSTIFSPLRTTSSVLKTTAQTASDSDINDTFSIYYGVKADDSIAPGVYKMASDGAIVYYLTMNTICTQYTISFNANGGTGTVANQRIQEGSTAKLTSAKTLTAPTTTSYTDAANNTVSGTEGKRWTFWGWNTEIDGTGDWYKDRESVSNLGVAGDVITFYAQWKQPTLADLTTGTQVGTEKVINHNTMQDMSPAACYNSQKFTTINASYGHVSLTDTRNNLTYTVAKLPDGMCWMTKDLNLGRSSTIQLTSDDTDIASNFTLPVSNPSNFSTGTTSENINRATVYSSASIPTYTVGNTTYSGRSTAYYSYAAATADLNTYSKTSAVLTTSICPKNWDLPLQQQYARLRTAGSINSYNNTNSSYAGKNAGNTPYYFSLGGYRMSAGTVSNSSISGLTNTGYFWTADSISSTSARTSYVNSSGLSSGAVNSLKYYGASIRCVASSGRATINYDKNDINATGNVASQSNIEINSKMVSTGSGFSLAGYQLKNWNTEPNGSGVTVALSSPISVLNLYDGQEITLYAQWEPVYVISYVNNCETFSTGCTTATSNTVTTQNIVLTNNPSTGTETGPLGAYNKYTQTGYEITSWNTMADGSGTSYPVGATYTVPSGSVPGDGITLYAQWGLIYVVQYDGNGADNADTGMGSMDASTGLRATRHTNVAEGNSFNLFASNFKKAGYGFVGWSMDASAWSKLTDNDTSNDPKIWGPNELFTAPARSGDVLTLYAVWAPAETDGGSPVYLQNWTGCSSMTATTYDSTTSSLTVARDSVTALTDQRDGQVYAVAKLVDGACWMIENLRLADTHMENGSSVATTLSTTNTNIDITDNTLPITNIYNADSSLATTSNSLSPSSSAVYNSSSAPYGWCGASSSACFNQSRLNTTNTVADLDLSVISSVGGQNVHATVNYTVYSYGNYYNWYSATAGYGTYARNSNQPTKGDICPVGWHLPYGFTSSDYGGSRGGFHYLINQMNKTNTKNIRSFPNNFIYSGYWYNSNATNRGLNGVYWSSAANGNNNGYGFYVPSSAAPSANNSYNKYQGLPVRCVAGNPYTVTVNLDAHTQSVSFTDALNRTQTVSVNGGTTTLIQGMQYTISATYDSGYGIDSWSTTTGGKLGSSYFDPATYVVTADATLSIASESSSSYIIQYDGNGADNANTGMGPFSPLKGIKTVAQTKVEENDTFDLFAPNFKRAGYGFVGWSTDADAWAKLTDNDNNNDSKIWGPNELFTAPAYNGSRILTLYAIWAPAATIGGNPVYLQGWTGCSSLAATTYNPTTGGLTVSRNSITALTDQRDGQVYAVAKLADGNCWMIENLRLADTHEDGGNAVVTMLSTSNTNIKSNNSTLPITNTYASSTTSNHLSQSSEQNSTSDANYGWCTGNSASCINQSRLNAFNTTSNSSPLLIQEITSENSHQDFNNYVYSYGSYYNWYSATAGYGTYSISAGNVEGDLCPAGWKLPYGGQGTSGNDIGGTNGGYMYLDKQMGGTGVAQQNNVAASIRWRRFPNNFVYSGYFSGTSYSFRGNTASYATATSYGSGSDMAMTVSPTGANPSYGSKYYGRTVRCIAGS